MDLKSKATKRAQVGAGAFFFTKKAISPARMRKKVPINAGGAKIPGIIPAISNPSAVAMGIFLMKKRRVRATPPRMIMA